MTFDVNRTFEGELTRRKLAFIQEDQDTYRVRLESGEVTVNLANMRRNSERDRDPDAIRLFVEHVLEAFRSSRRAWSEASSFLLWAAEGADLAFGDSIRASVTDEVCRVLTLTDTDYTKISWVTPQMCDEWGITIEEASRAAFANQERLLDGIKLDVAQVQDSALGMVPVDSPYKASVIFARAFKPLVESLLGWPVLVVLPCRDFIYVIADKSPLVGRIGSVVVKEFRNSGYPITTEILRISDDGIQAIGRFPT